MTSRDLDRIRFVTRHFNDLQWLWMIPFALNMMVLGAAGFFRIPELLLLNVLILWRGPGLMRRVGSHYRQSFGEVEQRPLPVNAGRPALYSPAGAAPPAVFWRRAKGIVWLPFLLFPLALMLFLELFLAQSELPTSTLALIPSSESHSMVFGGEAMYVIFGCFYLVGWFWRERRLSQSYYLVFGVLLLGLGLLGAGLGVVMPLSSKLAHSIIFFLPTRAQSGMPLMLFGGTMCLCCLLDHLQLVWALRPAKEEPA